MTRILALDTSTSACSAALNIDGRVEETFVIAPQDHTKRLLPMVDGLLKANGLLLRDLDCIAFTQGPGSFTGLRIGVGIVQGLAFGADLPVLPLSTLAVMALTAQRLLQLPPETLVAPVLDARMGEVYGALYKIGDELEPQCCMADCVASPSDLLQRLKQQVADQCLCLVGSGCELLETAGSDLNLVTYPDIYPHACDAARLAEPLLQSGRTLPASRAAPVYVRNEVSWSKRKRIR